MTMDRGRQAYRVVATAGAVLVLAASAAPAQTVVVTSKPAHALVALVMGTTGTPRVLVEGSASPHTYQLRPSDAKAVADATVLVRISGSLEPFSERLARSLPKAARLVSLADAPGLTVLPRRRSPLFDMKSEPNHDEHVHAHSPGEHDHGNEPDDPHVWLDPLNAKVMLSYIAEELAKTMPANASAYRDNAAAAARQVEALQTELAAKLSPVAGKPFVVFHDSLQYLEHRFQLSAAGAVTISPEVQPGARRLSELRARISALGAVCVFGEPQYDARLVTSIVAGTKARSGSIDPEGTQLAAGPGFYASLMRGLASSIVACLGT